ncbi:MAG TPA: fructose-6-phosphate aldolase [Rhodospirillaceae bacterium]|jgi:transaldolase|nr:fructose-6-phosphate aldolase [Alphaproteobacteria bacterium]HBH26821.1 fructose-6-phosphate aldolase [Rhodospirillaceae bacterium]
MKFFADTADIAEIRDLAALGLADGVTTNPSLVAASGRDFMALIKEICAVVPGPVSAEVAATDEAGMRREADVLRAIAGNVVIKLPLTLEGLKVCSALTAEGTQTNVTLCFSAAQAILAAKAGATYVSPFVGRLDDVGARGMGLIAEILEIYRHYPDFTTQVLVASIRSPMHIVEAARLGAGVVTAPPAVLRQLAVHPLTDKGLAAFVEAWAKTGQKIVS